MKGINRITVSLAAAIVFLCLLTAAVPEESLRTENIAERIVAACEEQTEWAKDAKYVWERKPTIEKSKTHGTCVTYVACVLQRVGVLNNGEYIWHNGTGFGTGKVTGTVTDRMRITYYNNEKTLADLIDVLKPGDIVMFDDNELGSRGNGGHIEIYKSGYTFFSGGMNHHGGDTNTSNSRSEESSRKVLCTVRITE